MSDEILSNRHELLFLYDAKFVNPNGDPADENRPRIDEETDINIVTDVRLKRTIRDYLYDFKNMEIFIREIRYEGEKIQDAKMRFNQFLEPFTKKSNNIGLETALAEGKKAVLTQCIDIRLFGAVIPAEVKKKGGKGTEKGALVLVGPVQFRMGRSLHRVDVKFIQGTGAFASGEGKAQKTFREEYVLPYSLIAFYGIVNENAAQDTLMTEQDMDLLLEGMWNGTKNLITRTKVGQTPHLLLDVVYKERNYHYGDLDRLISLVSDKDHTEIRDASDYTIEVAPLINALSETKARIEKVRVARSGRITYTENGEHIDVVDRLREIGLNVEELVF